uniref:3'(2'),5'-bisphosphate nucleotidase n=1 Tax=Rhizophora mucronata TaxID=61149 RepID=A0A2P2JQZ4_RHIMU
MLSSLNGILMVKPKIKNARTKLLVPQLSSKAKTFCYSSSSVVMAAVQANSSMSYAKELAAAKKAASLAARLCQKVQKALLHSDVHSKSDKSPVTVADYGSQVLVSYVLQKEIPSEPFSLVAEEDSGDLREDAAKETLERITKLVNDTLASDGSYAVSTLSSEDVLRAIDSGKSEGGSQGRHWVLDPIDGTKGFLRGDQYAIALALLDEGRVVLGVLACPNLPLSSIGGGSQHALNNEVGCLFFASVGSGAYVQLLDGSSPVKVQVSAIENTEEASFFESYEAAHSMHDLSGSIANVWFTSLLYMHASNC